MYGELLKVLMFGDEQTRAAVHPRGCTTMAVVMFSAPIRAVRIGRDDCPGKWRCDLRIGRTERGPTTQSGP